MTSILSPASRQFLRLYSLQLFAFERRRRCGNTRSKKMGGVAGPSFAFFPGEGYLGSVTPGSLKKAFSSVWMERPFSFVFAGNLIQGELQI
jgi:hypothetical protein